MQSKEFQRLISRGMPNSIGAAEAWREAALKVPPKKRQAGSAKRVRQEGELTAKQMAEALGICEQSVYMYWTAGMPRTSVPVKSTSFEPEWVEIHNWGATSDKETPAKRWMAAAPECAQKFFEERIVPFLEKGGFYSTEHDIHLGRGVAVLR